MEDKNLDILQETVSAMAKCDSRTLTAAIAMLPDHKSDGAAIVVAAAARVIAEQFEDTASVLEAFAKIVRQNREIIDKQKEDLA